MLARHTGTSPCPSRPFPLPPTLRMVGGGTCLSQSADWQNKGFILCCRGNQPSLLDPSHCARGTEMTVRAGLGEFGDGWEPPSRLLGPVSAEPGEEGTPAEINRRVWRLAVCG